MKKTLYLLFVFFVISHSWAQYRQRYGITVGPNYSKFRGMDVSGVDYSYAPGLSLGIAYEYYLKENLSIKTNFFYENKKSKAVGELQMRQEVDSSPTVTETVVYSYQYITLPVMIQYHFKKAKGFFVNGGIFMGYLLDSEAKGEGDNALYASVTDFTSSTFEYNNKFDFGFVLGAGKAFQLNPKNHLVVEVRNSHGVFQTNKNNTFDGNIVRSNSYALLLGWVYSK